MFCSNVDGEHQPSRQAFGKQHGKYSPDALLLFFMGAEGAVRNNTTASHAVSTLLSPRQFSSDPRPSIIRGIVEPGLKGDSLSVSLWLRVTYYPVNTTISVTDMLSIVTDSSITTIGTASEDRCHLQTCPD